jgi:hypothetical protein
MPSNHKKVHIRSSSYSVLQLSLYSKTWLIRNSYNLKFCDNSNFSFNLHPEEEKFIQIYLIISKTLMICNSKQKSAL